LSADALALALAAAALHAGWNLLIARARDVQAATGVAVALAAVIFAPLAALTWRADADVWPYVAASAALELAYFALLAYAYGRAELSVVYPVARGGAPVLVLLLSVPLLGTDVSALEALGVGAVAAGVLLIRGTGRANAGALALGVAIAACIAGYTLVDSRGIDHANAVAYAWLVAGLPGLALVAWTWRRRGSQALRGELGAHTVAAAIAMLGAYTLVLLALRLAPAASVAAVRETSVVIAVALAALVLHERVTRARAAGAAVVAAGVVLLVSA
jgi:drug/metabolite transporter (DMT)-like permease